MRPSRPASSTGTAQAATWTSTYGPSSGGLATITDPLGNTSQATYDSNGNITSTTDPLGHTTSATYDALNDLKRRLIVEAVRENGGVITKAAERLGLHPNHLHRLITTLGLREEIE